jgi:hypothetical protein
VEAWQAHVEREERRYRDGLTRLPDGADARQKQLVRVANAAAGAGLASLMAGRGEAARMWFRAAATRYRESYAGAPPGSWGRPIGAVKMRLLSGDAERAEADARWALTLSAAESDSPIGRYAAALAELVLGRDAAAGRLAESLRDEPEERFPRSVGDALAGLAHRDRDLYADGLERTLRSFETREQHLEDVAVADTVLALEALARPRGMEVDPRSPLLPPRLGPEDEDGS